MAWYDASAQQLNLVLGTQSPMGDISDCASIFDSSAFPVKNVDLISCYPGGGFGGRDQSYFSEYIAMAAPFAKQVADDFAAGTNKISRLVAYGQYDSASNTFVASRISVALHE